MGFLPETEGRNPRHRDRNGSMILLDCRISCVSTCLVAQAVDIYIAGCGTGIPYV